jgi:hypothetical protein
LDNPTVFDRAKCYISTRDSCKMQHDITRGKKPYSVSFSVISGLPSNGVYPAKNDSAMNPILIHRLMCPSHSARFRIYLLSFGALIIAVGFLTS